MRKLLAVFILVLALAVPGISGATTVAYDNLGAGDSYMPFGNWFGTSGSTTYQVAGQFTPTAGGTLEGLVLGMTHMSGNNNMTLSLLSDAGGEIGSLLWSQTFNDLLSGDSAVYLGQLNGPALAAGQSYWLTAETDASSMQSWWRNSTGADGNMAMNDNGSWYYWNDADYAFAMRVEVGGESEPIPEPSTMLLVGLGLAGVAVYRKRTTCVG